jgi:DNA-binding MarR family transcriptional regulator
MKHLDVGHLGQFLGQAFERAVFEKMETGGFADVKGVHGYVVQRLIEGPQSASAMASDLGVTQQAVAKWVAELRALELLTDAPAGEDARERRIQLTAKGNACVKASRDARAKVAKQLEKALGSKAMTKLHARLSDALEALGGLDAVRQRRVRVPPSRSTK